MSRRLCSLAALAACLALWGCGNERGDGGSTASATGSNVASASASVSGSASATSAGSALAAPVDLERDASALPELETIGETMPEQHALMVKRMRALDATNETSAKELLAFLDSSNRMGQGNPQVWEHPMTRSECVQKRAAAGVKDEKKAVCGDAFMVPVFDPRTQKEEDAKVCIDRYEFPGIPCEYPMTWTSTAEAQHICKILGKRLCDAHEWEGACAGALLKPEDEYAFGRPRRTMQGMHNLGREVRWAYGFKKDYSKCGTNSFKSKKCTTIGWKHCGSNTYPAGSFPECKSPFGVYDQHGNAAEHMALPMKPEELGSRGGFGTPEMKGSWFIFSKVEAHIDDCRWRAPDWHANEGKNHFNYHLGFRCCKDIPGAAASPKQP